MPRKGLLAALCLVAGSAQAEGLYLQAGLGAAEYDFGTSANVDSTAFMFGLGLGYEFNDYLALEGGYTSLGTLDMSSPEPAPTDTDTWEWSTGGFEVTLVPALPITEELSLYAKAGKYFWELDAQKRPGAAGDKIYYATGSDVTYGAGLEYNAWRFEYQHYELGSVDVETFKLAYKLLF